MIWNDLKRSKEGKERRKEDDHLLLESLFKRIQAANNILKDLHYYLQNYSLIINTQYIICENINAHTAIIEK